jgi:hypothetical protein
MEKPRWKNPDGKTPMEKPRWKNTDGKIPMEKYRWKNTDGKIPMEKKYIKFASFVFPHETLVDITTVFLCLFTACLSA